MKPRALVLSVFFNSLVVAANTVAFLNAVVTREYFLSAWALTGRTSSHPGKASA